MKELYLGLIEQKWTLNDIDDMDMWYYLDLLIYKAKGENQTVTIDQVF